MTKATTEDKDSIVNILTAAFAGNRSVLYIVKNDNRIMQRVKKLMQYSFETCMRSGEVWLSDDKKACALFLLPGKKKTTLRSVMADIRFVLFVTGITNARKVLTREKKIHALHPAHTFHYLWFIAVEPSVQRKGAGSAFLQELLQYYKDRANCICLETSTQANIPWYRKAGFAIYNELDLGYPLFFLKKENSRRTI